MQETEFIWHNGELKPWHSVKVHVLSHAIHYGSSVFEGIRSYDTPKGPMIFRLKEHIERLFYSAKVYQMRIPYSVDEIMAACRQTVRDNGLKSAYIRPVVLRGYGSIGVTTRPDDPIETAIAAIEWGAYLGDEALNDGVDVCVSSWNRLAPNTIPPAVKAGGNYLSSQLISQEAQRLGFHEGIGLSVNGMLSEGAGENLFLILDGVIYTPTAGASILFGITRNAVMTLARDLGYEVVERDMPREMLYMADEIFLTGTAAEITPVRSVDRIPVGSGTRGPITRALQEAFFGLFSGETEDRYNWLTPVEDGEHAQVAV